jgi:hypothetical protein
MFCCIGLENLAASVRERGIAVVIRRTQTQIEFALQSRTVDVEDESKLRPLPIDLTINITCSMQIRYCPCCGYDLQKLAADFPEFFANIAAEQQSQNR